MRMDKNVVVQVIMGTVSPWKAYDTRSVLFSKTDLSTKSSAPAVAWWGAQPMLHGKMLSNSDQLGAFEPSYWQILPEEEEGKIAEQLFRSGKEFSLKERG